jgi:hypothetical protein
MGEIRNAYKHLAGKPEGKRQLGRHRCRCGNVILGCKGRVCDIVN